MTKSLALYLLGAVGGTVTFLSLAPVVGYLPYSDRPGPGCLGSFSAVNWHEFVQSRVYQSVDQSVGHRLTP